MYLTPEDVVKVNDQYYMTLPFFDKVITSTYTVEEVKEDSFIVRCDQSKEINKIPFELKDSFKRLIVEKFTLFYSGPFSQWFPSKFVVDGKFYNRSEQYMMQQKALLFNDADTSKKIMEAKDPKTQKALGRKVKDFNKETWDNAAKGIVYKGNMAKFTQSKDLLKKLLATDGTLVEASPVDKIWGIGLTIDDPKALNRELWQGTNWLGEVLTKVRDDIKKEIENEYQKTRKL